MLLASARLAVRVLQRLAAFSARNRTHGADAATAESLAAGKILERARAQVRADSSAMRGRGVEWRIES